MIRDKIEFEEATKQLLDAAIALKEQPNKTDSHIVLSCCTMIHIEIERIQKMCKQKRDVWELEEYFPDDEEFPIWDECDYENRFWYYASALAHACDNLKNRELTIYDKENIKYAILDLEKRLAEILVIVW